MPYLHFEASDGRLLQGHMWSDGDYSDEHKESVRLDHERGYGVSPLIVREDETDICEGRTDLIEAPPRPAVPRKLTVQERLDALEAKLSG